MTRTLLLSAVALAFAGCPGPTGGGSDGGTGGSTSGGGGGGLTLSQFCTRLLSSLSATESQCMGGPVSVWQSAFQGDNFCPQIEASVSAGRLKYDASHAQACLTEFTSASCAQFTSGPQTVSPDCKAALSGAVATGGSCYGSMGECTPGDACTMTACPGTCKAEIAAGASCAGGDTCVSGYSCNSSPNSSSLCTQNPAIPPTASQGQSCGGQSSNLCGALLYCSPSSTTCQSIVREGGTCTPGEGQCESFTYCGSSNTCTLWPSAGDACGLMANGEAAGCLPGNFCNMPQGQTSGTCAVQLAAGAACTASSECLHSASCTGGVCATPCSGP